MKKSAPFIVIEGIDGSGKGTQSVRLHERLNQSGHSATLLSFPRYQSTFFGARIGDFLNGKFGTLDQLPPFLVSLLYAGDRFESRNVLESARENSDVIVLDRYVPSNIAHQTAKAGPEERSQLQEWIEHIEYNIFQLPKPDLVVLLDIPVSVSQELIRRKNPRSYTDQTTDLQESDTSYLAAVRDVYLSLAKKSPNWQIVSVTDGEQLRSIDDIADDLWERVQTLIAST